MAEAKMIDKRNKTKTQQNQSNIQSFNFGNMMGSGMMFYDEEESSDEEDDDDEKEKEKEEENSWTRQRMTIVVATKMMT